MKEYAPIALFAFNRPDLLRSTLDALRANPEAPSTELFIFVDGPRNDEDAEKTASVLFIARSAKGFARVEVRASSSNRGLGPSIIAGVSDIVSRYGRVIVMEDDLVVTPNFLSYMNAGLERFGNEDKVFSICGYSLDLRLNAYKYDTYLGHRSSSWGWATWKDRWESVDWDPSENLIDRRWRAFNRWGGSDCSRMLSDWRKGKNKSWAIRFCFSQFLQDKLSLFPVMSLVNPDGGFTGEGTNCKKYSRFRFVMDDGRKREFTYPDSMAANPLVISRSLGYHSLSKRIWSRLMYIIYR